MADILTQLQDALDILLQQFYAGLRYTNDRHPSIYIPGQPHDANREASAKEAENGPAANATSQQSPPATTANANAQAAGGVSGETSAPRSPSPDPDFAATQHEIASDIVLNMARIQALIERLPGIGLSEKDQLERMKELDQQLREEDERLLEAKKEKERLRQLLDERILKVRRP
ncbi:mediator complex, subunit Med21 [Phyllosticta capitalensis]|uniref:Mediator of RNA polymerase II transcription subunit 21 n=1 Tax=Phyllosticta capitalensis TaxID=121624 RepID=A0ABR1YA13_9PEZI